MIALTQKNVMVYSHSDALPPGCIEVDAQGRPVFKAAPAPAAPQETPPGDVDLFSPAAVAARRRYAKSLGLPIS